MSEIALSVSHASKTFITAGKPNKALNDVSFSVQAGETVALLGASGSGKSTLIRAMSGLESLDKGSGQLEIFGQVMQADGKVTRQVRQVRSSIGIIFQQFNLVSQLDVITNVLIGACPKMNVWEILTGRFSTEDKARALDALEKVGLVDFAYQRASTLSGGQQQRVAVARALLKGAKVLLADEPVASLDPESARKVMEILSELTRKFNLTLITSLHQIPIAKRYCQRTIALNKGVLVFDGKTEDLSLQMLADLYGSEVDDLISEELEVSYQTSESRQTMAEVA